MDTPAPVGLHSQPLSAAEPGAPSAEDRWSAVSCLLNKLDESSRAEGLAAGAAGEFPESQLVRVRLGMATSLFLALRARHAPTASHSLRVALGISSWSLALGLTEEQCHLAEVAALLHDIGKIGVPDQILLKPGALSGEELLLMERQRQIGCEILRGCCAVPEMLDVVSYAAAWYDGSRRGFNRRGNELPAGSRMIAIVDAYDSMTSDHLYRRAMPRERALAELFQHAGDQFDPQLVQSFCELVNRSQLQLRAQVARRWLQQIPLERANTFWTLPSGLAPAAGPGPESQFHESLLEAMRDGVVFVDANLEILVWNRAAERITGLSAAGVLRRRWLPSIVHMSDERGRAIADEECPVRAAIRSGVQSLRRICIRGRGKPSLCLDVHVAPVVYAGGQVRGATMILHDASSEITLEERVRRLHERATRDALTKVANRAEFDRLFPKFVETHLHHGLPCSLVMCDIDHFKRVNDEHGHQAGDEALLAFASLLRRHAREGDLVARYGGEEFVILCADCDNATATRRAEEMRRQIADTPLPVLANAHITASFGVTEIQAGDTPETFLRRADRALLQAKANGRNVVVQLGTGIQAAPHRPPAPGWFSRLRGSPGEILVQRTVVTPVPVCVAIEKVRGFAADQHAQIVSLQDHRAILRIDNQGAGAMRRRSDRPVPFVLELAFEKLKAPVDTTQRTATGTLIHIVIRPRRSRDRRRQDAAERAGQLLLSLNSYLMAQEAPAGGKAPENGPDPASLLARAKRLLAARLRD